jgi:hypothetical protein
MTSERSRAYARVVKTIDDMGPAKLLDLEVRRVRNAADALLFAGPDDPEAIDALSDIEHLADHLVSSGRWTTERAACLAGDVAACGPAWIETVPVWLAA